MTENWNDNVPARHDRKAIAKMTRVEAGLWRALRCALRVVDGTAVIGKGIYETKPELMLALREAVDAMRPALRQHDKELTESAR